MLIPRLVLFQVRSHNTRFAQGRETYSKTLNKFSDKEREQLVAQLNHAVPITHYYQGTSSELINRFQTQTKKMSTDFT